MAATRVVSLDLFRGVVIIAMVFVNYIEDMTDIPAWLKHTPESVSGLTFVDVIFPAFLFIVGIAIPFTLENRVNETKSVLPVLRRIIFRSLALIIVGLYEVNSFNYLTTGVTVLTKEVWQVLAFLSVILIWNVYPQAVKSKVARTVYPILRTGGWLILFCLALVYLGSGPRGTLVGMRTQWWGILGLIGWAYFFASIIYLVSRRYSLTVLIGWLIFLYGIYFVDRLGLFKFIPYVSSYFSFSITATHTAIVLSGVVAGKILQENITYPTLKRKLNPLILISLVQICAGLGLINFYGIHKVAATPSWGLLSSGLCGLSFLVCYVYLEFNSKVGIIVKSITTLGTNPIQIYILPYLILPLFKIVGLNQVFVYAHSGFPGIIKGLVFTGFIVGLSLILTRMDLRLKL